MHAHGTGVSTGTSIRCLGTDFSMFNLLAFYIFFPHNVEKADIPPCGRQFGVIAPDFTTSIDSTSSLKRWPYITMKSKAFSGLFAGAMLVVQSCCSSDCAPYPLSLEVGNVTLATGQIARGVLLGIGTPSQPMAFLPRLYGTSAHSQNPRSSC